MQNKRSWQDSFEKLERARSDERLMPDADERQIREAEAAYAAAVRIEAERGAVPGFMLDPADTAPAESLVEPPGVIGDDNQPPRVRKPARKKAGARKTGKGKAAPRTRKTAARKPKAKADAKTGSKAAGATTRRKPAAAKAASLPEALSPEPAAVQPVIAPLVAEPPVGAVAPLARNVSPAPYRAPGLADAIGYWLRDARRRASALLGMRLKRASREMAKSAGHAAGISPGPDEVQQELAGLRAENARLRARIAELIALNDGAGKASQG